LNIIFYFSAVVVAAAAAVVDIIIKEMTPVVAEITTITQATMAEIQVKEASIALQIF
jgi:predicted Zn-dependent protease